ncbi:hypothetical protein M0804_011467 [Polistes exclamans]|nr:hypothetical protein M0804_011467 [Polistes exclamans]
MKTSLVILFAIFLINVVLINCDETSSPEPPPLTPIPPKPPIPLSYVLLHPRQRTLYSLNENEAPVTPLPPESLAPLRSLINVKDISCGEGQKRDGNGICRTVI